ncbi:hypothetical protein BCV70DRAFT_210084 [Testicularia cyperi]|uniref:Nucleotide-sugar transporter n=1 Tax=Testicularia cyperi TaxID=1882483 RepID=A0A317XVF0_9BASI|nr:hypothetical protein BCV70DRAFT_210084 [Testicularia cyperi]
MFGSLTPLIVTISGLKSGTSIVFHQASRHAAYSPSLTVLLCESVKIVCSLFLLTRALWIERRENLINTDYIRLEAEDYEVNDAEDRPSQAIGEGVVPKPQTLWRAIYSQIFALQGLRLIAPAVIYVVQNNLYLYAASELDPAFFQAFWQVRILISALLSFYILKRKITAKQWLSLLAIFFGVLLVKLATTRPTQAATSASQQRATTSAIIALCCAAILSSVAGVILEIIFRDRTTNLWASNVQLSAFSILPAATIVIFKGQDLAPVARDLTRSPWPLGVVFCQSFNGMMIALLLKKAGVVVNDLTSAMSIILTFGLNSVLFPPEKPIAVGNVVLVIAGSAVILASSMLYQHYSEKESEKSASVSLPRPDLELPDSAKGSVDLDKIEMDQIKTSVLVDAGNAIESGTVPVLLSGRRYSLSSVDSH